MNSTISKRQKLRIGLTVIGIAGGAWLIDAGTKYLANEHLGKLPPPHGYVAIKDFLYFVLGTNTGGSNGIPSEYMEFCLSIPAVIMFIAASWLGRRLKKGQPVPFLAQVGLGLFIGGALGNWSERVLHSGVTDFIFLQPVGFCIFNLADIFIDMGYMLLAGLVVRAVLMEEMRRRREVQCAKVSQ